MKNTVLTSSILLISLLACLIFISYNLCGCSKKTLTTKPKIEQAITKKEIPKKQIAKTEPLKEIIVKIDAEIINTDGKIKVSGTTNLPETLELLCSIYNKNDDLMGQDRITITNNKFETQLFSVNDNPYPSGEYYLEITSGAVGVFPESIKTIVGTKGERLKGDLVKEPTMFKELGKSIEYKKPFTVSSANSDLQKQKITKYEQQAQQIKQKTKKLYQELLVYKKDPKFKEVGFGQCCKYNKWLIEIESLQDQLDKIRKETGTTTYFKLAISIGDLKQVGLKYAMNKGQDNDYCTNTLQEIKENL